MADLQLFQVREPVVRGRHAAQVVCRVGEHQARSVDSEHRVCRRHDLPDRLFHPHLAEPQPAQLDECVPHVLQGNLHCSHLSADGAKVGRW